MDTLNMIEQVEVDNKDKPIEDIAILKAQVFVDPYQEVDDQVRYFTAVEFSLYDFYSNISCVVGNRQSS